MTKTQAVVTPPATDEIDYAKFIEKAVKLRDKIAEMKSDYEKAVEPYKQAFAKLEGFLLNELDRLKLDNMKKKGAGTIGSTERWTPSVPDPDTFLQYVIANNAWAMLDVKANQTATKDFVKKNGGALPPGVNVSVIRKLTLRRDNE